MTPAIVSLLKNVFCFVKIAFDGSCDHQFVNQGNKKAPEQWINSSRQEHQCCSFAFSIVQSILLKPLMTAVANLQVNSSCGWKFSYNFLFTFVLFLNGNVNEEDNFIKNSRAEEQELDQGSFSWFCK